MMTITEYGAKPDGALHTARIQAAIDAAWRQGGGTLLVPAGAFRTGALFLKDNVTLHLEPGAVLRFSDDPADYPVVTSRSEGREGEVYASCLYAQGARNIAVTGQGTLDGNGSRWWAAARRRSGETLRYPRPKLVSFDGCEGVLLRDITLLNSPFWTVNPIRCKNVTCDRLTIQNPADSPNTDGINPDSCANVHISNCHIDVGDDCIAIKSGREYAAERIPCENITIANCTMVHGHGGVVLGSEMSGDIRNVVISGCVFQGTDRGIRLKSRRGRGGVVEDVRVSNVIMDGVACPFVMNLYFASVTREEERPIWTREPAPVTEETPCFRRIHFASISAVRVRAAAGFIQGLSERYVEDVTFDNVDVSLALEAVPERPAMMPGVPEMTRRGFYIGCATGVAFRNVTLANHQGAPFVMEDVGTISFLGCPQHASPFRLDEGS